MIELVTPDEILDLAKGGFPKGQIWVHHTSAFHVTFQWLPAELRIAFKSVHEGYKACSLPQPSAASTPLQLAPSPYSMPTAILPGCCYVIFFFFKSPGPSFSNTWPGCFLHTLYTCTLVCTWMSALGCLLIPQSQVSCRSWWIPWDPVIPLSNIHTSPL